MSWSEQWRSVDRPDSSEIPDEFSISARSTEKMMLVYFTGTTIIAYLGMKFIGTRDQLIAGLPVMMWTVVLVSVLVILGLYAVFTRSEPSEQVADLGDSTEAKHE
ncbi:hypothetical protein EL22_17820 [Halostagnicola sp. A56]|uniref:hypothetical protein n=1 Tax=Halostagnicola sp. A56 TaxID=1495067 RepID=UPI00049F3C18|nr:hypothetical protein [Halostagnicola sp. A56]KDE59766.1 hypothetical protein EL22_17820 [Halostagnicola sp. A56]